LGHDEAPESNDLCALTESTACRQQRQFLYRDFSKKTILQLSYNKSRPTAPDFPYIFLYAYVELTVRVESGVTMVYNTQDRCFSELVHRPEF
jgi:hypothetical protein